MVDCLGRELVVGVACQQRQDLDQLVVGVVVELDRGPKATRQARIGCDERLHRSWVAGHDDNKIVPPVLHLFDQGVHCLGAVLVSGQAVCLVDEQHATDRGGDNLGGLDGGLAKVPSHQLGAVDLDQLALRQQLERGVDAADQPRHRRLSRARVAVEHQVPGDRRTLHPCVGSQPLDPQERHLTVDLTLDPLQADQGVELGQQLIEALVLHRCWWGRLRGGLGEGLGCGLWSNRHT